MDSSLSSYFSSHLIELFFVLYFAVVVFTYLLLTISALYEGFFRYRFRKIEEMHNLLRSESLPEITFIVPVFNGSTCIVRTIHNILGLTYRYKKIVIVNDGSTDNTLQVLGEELDLMELPFPYEEIIKTKPIVSFHQSKKHPNVFVVNKMRGSKGDAINAGINATDTPFFIESDDDTFLEDTYLNYLIANLVTEPETIVIGGSVRILDGCDVKFRSVETANFPKSILPGIQALEYMRAFTVGRLGWNLLGGNILMSGALALFQTQAVRDVGGYITDNPAEDMDIILRLHKYMLVNKKKYKITFLPDPVAWTHVPLNLSGLRRQRRTWHRGLSQCLWEHRDFLFNPKFGKIGMISFPFYVFFEEFAPVMEVMAYIFALFYFAIFGLGYHHLLFGLVGYATLLVMTLTCLLIEEVSFRRYSSVNSLLKFMGCLFVEHLFFRQLTLLWRIEGIWVYWRLWREKRLNPEGGSKRKDAVTHRA